MFVRQVILKNKTKQKTKQKTTKQNKQTKNTGGLIDQTQTNCPDQALKTYIRMLAF